MTSSLYGQSTSREKRYLNVSDASSLFDLQAELYRKKADIEKKSKDFQVPTASTSKKGILFITKDEAKAKAEENKQREIRLKKLERSLKEEEEQQQRIQRILQEKSEIYSRLSNGESLAYQDGNPVEFLVDFTAKAREDECRRIEEEEKAKAEKSEAVHFVANEEQRLYGASHFTFSQSEAKRQEEMKELLELTQKTKVDREKRKEFLEKRELQKIERLNKVRKRKGLEEIKPPSEIAVQYLDIPLPDDDKVESKKKKKPIKVREWDKGKEAYMKWINGRRDERDEEFGPPSSYFLK